VTSLGLVLSRTNSIGILVPINKVSIEGQFTSLKALIIGSIGSYITYSI
jgi:hypothetical protein